MARKTIDIILLSIFPIFATLLTMVLRTNLLVSILLFFGAPATYVTLRNPPTFKKSCLFALIVSIPLSLVVDTLAAINGAWIIPNSLFSFRFFGVATIEVYLFGLLWVLYAVLFYEFLLDHRSQRHKLDNKIVYYISLSLALILYVIVGLFIDGALLIIPYFYAFSGAILVVLPLVAFLARYPTFIRRFVLATAYFGFLLFLFEMAALATGQWVFPGAYIGFLPVLGHEVPFEEIAVWMIFATPSILAYYEYFADGPSL